MNQSIPELEQHPIPSSVAFAIDMAKAYSEAYGYVPGAIESLVERTVPLYADEITFDNLPAISAYLEAKFPSSAPDGDSTPEN